MKTKNLEIMIPADHFPAARSLEDLRINILQFFDFGDFEPESIVASVVDCAKGLYAQAIESGRVHLAWEKDKILCEVVYQVSDFVQGQPLENISQGVGLGPRIPTRVVWELPPLLPRPSSS
jgi:hypothetical protein